VVSFPNPSLATSIQHYHDQGTPGRKPCCQDSTSNLIPLRQPLHVTVQSPLTTCIFPAGSEKLRLYSTCTTTASRVCSSKTWTLKHRQQHLLVKKLVELFEYAVPPYSIEHVSPDAGSQLVTPIYVVLIQYSEYPELTFSQSLQASILHL